MLWATVHMVAAPGGMTSENIPQGQRYRGCEWGWRLQLVRAPWFRPGTGTPGKGIWANDKIPSVSKLLEMAVVPVLKNERQL